jgi:hypothetical protein
MVSQGARTRMVHRWATSVGALQKRKRKIRKHTLCQVAACETGEARMIKRLLVLTGLIMCVGSAVAQTETGEFSVLETFNSWNQGWMEGNAGLGMRIVYGRSSQVFASSSFMKGFIS